MRRINSIISSSKTKKDYGILAASAITNRIVAYTIVTIGLYSGAILIFLKHGIPLFLSNLFIILLFGVTGYFAFLLQLAFNKNAAQNLTKLYLIILKTQRHKHHQQGKEVRAKASLTN